MARGFLIDRIHDKHGISFRACETAGAMVDLMNTQYNKRLKNAAQWLVDKANEDGLDKFLANLKASIGRWTLEIIGESRQ